MNAQSLHFERLFREKRIPFRLVGTTGFYSREEVKDALAYLSLLANPNDEVRFRRVVNKPGRGVGEASVEKIITEWRSDGGGTSRKPAGARPDGFPRARGRGCPTSWHSLTSSGLPCLRRRFPSWRGC